jgi:acetylornithine deacetylase/succinyl-diaminopimelate desuccinylase-like protein
MIHTIIQFAFILLFSVETIHGQGFLTVNGRQIVDGRGNHIILRGIGLGGWMLQEPYMLKLDKVAGTQYEIKKKISELIGQENTNKFYSAYRYNMIRKRDIDSLKVWGFNSIRLPMHYNLFTLPVENEPVPDRNTWIDTGFRLIDSLLSWCKTNKIYLILDLHAAPGGQGKDRPIADIDTTKPRLWDSEANQQKTIELWTRLAERYSKEEWIGGYDLINETNWNMEGNESLKDLFLKITTEIRKVDKNHIIFIEGNQFANDFTGLVPPWDKNMAYSFHKYWSETTIESIQRFIDIREKYNVPLWMGESGENTNDWFKAAVNLFESNDIGWAWWTIKKIGSESGIMDVKEPRDYQKIIDYWSGKATKPTREQALAIFMELADNMKLEKCRINYGVLKALFQTGIAPGEVEQHSDSMNRKLARDLFKELIEINTTSGFGSTRAAEAMYERLKTAGFQSGDIQLTGPDNMHKNLVVRYRGNGKLAPVLFICHLDVVAALRQDWTVDPFTFLEKDGYFYGRGTTDIKNEDASLVANLIRLKQEGFKPDRDIILALTADEEGGNANGVYWLLTNHRDLINAEYCINPDGGGGNLKNGKHVLMEIQTSEKIYVNFQLEVKNDGGHSSLPMRENAIYRLASGLSRLSGYNFPVMLNETTHNFFEKIAAMESLQNRTDIQAILRIPPDTAAANRLFAYSPYYNAMMRTTCVATMLSAGHAENALPQTARAIINCRMLPEERAENVMSRLKAVINDSLIAITRLNSSFIAPLSPLRKDVMKPVEQIASAMWPGVIVTPAMSTGASDGKYLRRDGIPVYGVSGMFSDMDNIRAHGKDERIGVNEFYEGVEFMYRFIKAVSSEN